VSKASTWQPNLSGDAPDLAGADDAHRLTEQIEADQAAQREVLFSDAIEGAMNPAVEREQ
jgi:hypothetical protein